MTRSLWINVSGVAVLAAALYAVYFAFNASDGTFWALILLFPMAIGVAMQTLCDPDLRVSAWDVTMRVALLIAALSAILVIFALEALLCVAIAAPFFLGFSWLGVVLSRRALSRLAPTQINGSALVLALLVPVSGFDLPLAEGTYRVEDSIEISAPPHAVWAQIMDFPQVTEAERLWTATHTLGAPMPNHSSVTGTIRHAHWTQGVSYQEHLTRITPDQTLAWTFHFAPDFRMGAYNNMIHPDSRQFALLSGGYDLIATPKGTRLELHTTYRLRTLVNPYIALLGQRLLSDNHRSILHVIAKRATAS